MEEPDRAAHPYGGKTAPIDADSGQRGAFPGLDDHLQGDELFYGPANDGMEYLRMVRSEARAVPKLLRVHEENANHAGSPYATTNGDGRYEDGAFVAAPLNGNSDVDMADSLSQAGDDVQGIYYAGLVKRFLQFRDLITNPPAELRQQPKPTLPKALQLQSRKPHWNYDLKHTSPTPKSLLSATQADVIRGLGRIQSLLTKSSMTADSERTNLACWTWTLLGRSRDIGTLGSEDVSVLRDLAKTALSLASKLERSQKELVSGEKNLGESTHDPADPDQDDKEQMAARMDKAQDFVPALKTLENVPAENLSGPNVASEDLDKAKQAMLERLRETGSTDQPSIDAGDSADRTGMDRLADALVALDIIVTIVGNVFGQRDLLDLRTVWQ